MLIIKKRHMAVRAIVAGLVAFTVGLMGVAAYVDRSLQHENLVFDTERNVDKAPPTTASTEQTPAAAQQAAPSDSAATPQVAGSTRTTAPAQSAPAPAATPTAPVASSPPTEPTGAGALEPGRGGGGEPPSKSEEGSKNTNVLDVVVEIFSQP